MNGATLHKKPVEFIDSEKIVLDYEGSYPRKIIIRDRSGTSKEYRLVKTKAGCFTLNK